MGLNRYLRRHLQPPEQQEHSYPALEQWRLELRAGKRTVTTFDDLWRQACREAYYEEEGLPLPEEK